MSFDIDIDDNGDVDDNGGILMIEGSQAAVAGVPIVFWPPILSNHSQGMIR